MTCPLSCVPALTRLRGGVSSSAARKKALRLLAKRRVAQRVYKRVYGNASHRWDANLKKQPGVDVLSVVKDEKKEHQLWQQRDAKQDCD